MFLTEQKINKRQIIWENLILPNNNYKLNKKEILKIYFENVRIKNKVPEFYMIMEDIMLFNHELYYDLAKISFNEDYDITYYKTDEEREDCIDEIINQIGETIDNIPEHRNLDEFIEYVLYEENLPFIAEKDDEVMCNKKYASYFEHDKFVFNDCQNVLLEDFIFMHCVSSSKRYINYYY